MRTVTNPQLNETGKDPVPSGDNRCCTAMITDWVASRVHNEQGFMGMTHALSACAIVLALIAFAPGFVDNVLGSWHPAFITLLCLVLIGGALMPDLDNTNSSAESSLGFIGSGISAVMRATAPIIQGLLHTKYDKDTDNPHRGFYHTAVSACLVGALGVVLCSMPGMAGKVSALVFAFIGTHVALCTLLKKPLKALGKSKILGAVIPFLLTLAVIMVLWRLLPGGTPYWKIGVAFGAGWLVHILGDMCTTQGVPVLWPIPIKGKMWYDVRLLKIKAGGVVENVVFTPLFLLIIVVCIIHIVSHQVGMHF